MLDSTVVFSELMYNPGDNQDLEWIELHNEMAVDMDISGWNFDGLNYEFPNGTILEAGEYLVVAKSPALFQSASGYDSALGPYGGRMNNAGETLRLINNSGRVMDEVRYDNRDPWPAGADGSGASLAKLHPDGGSESIGNWTTSDQLGGTPGQRNFPEGPALGSTSILVPDQQVWRYDDRNIDWGTDWLLASFDPDDPNGDNNPEDAWQSGPGWLGSIDSELIPAIETPLDLGPTTYYFLTTFNFAGDPAAVVVDLNAIIDDGAVVYLNGNEVARINMPDGPVDFQTPAASAVGIAESSGHLRISASDLVTGRNILAVEVHQAASGVTAGGTPPTSVLEVVPEPGFTINWNGKDGQYFDAAAPPTGSIVPANSARASAGASAFSGSDLGPDLNIAFHVAENLNDGLYGNSNSWIGGNNNPFAPVQFAGIRFAEPQDVLSIAWGRDNGNNVSDACGGQCTDRSMGAYTLQYTAVADVNQNTTDTGDATSGWSTIGKLIYRSNQDSNVGDGFTSYLRHEYDVRQNGQPIRATGIRIIVPGTGANSGTAIDEIEVYTTTTVQDAPDVVFGASLQATEVLPPTPRVLINEVAAADSREFFVELVNLSEQNVDLSGYSLGNSRSSFVRSLAGLSLDAGGIISFDGSQLGFAPQAGDRLYLFAQQGHNLSDAVRVEDHNSARSRQHDVRWLIPDRPTPGTANPFDFEQDIVINEILYHAPGTAKSSIPATFNNTTILPLDENTEWRFLTSANGLPADWSTYPHSVGVDGWQVGPALLGFERSTLVEPIRTEFPNPTTISPTITTYYFEREFDVSRDLNDPAVELFLRHIIDDGAVFYVNGRELFRFNIPDGPFDSSTIARPSVNNAAWSEWLAIPRDYLVIGTNRVSVEVHQSSPTSNDVVFGVELKQRRQLTDTIPGQPFQESNEEWIELYNRSDDRTINLSDWRIDDAAEFTFPKGTTIGPQEYRIVAGNVTEFVTKYPELSSIVVGQFQGRLSNQDETVRLIDANGNPADEVHYFDNGRWDNSADGGGATLELTDAFADNQQPEAWSASREWDQSSWETISYRDTIVADGFTNGVSQRFHEFILGLLDDGVVLIDDVSVIEDPDGAAIERIQNGTFNDDPLGTTPHTWRFGGNHSGVVVADPTRSQNHVLQLTATGALEDRLNHAETTFTENAALRDGEEYAISFRAKWVGGSNQVHSRLYFDRLARTTLLERPTRIGTPGAANSTVQPNIGPTYTQLAHQPTIPNANEPVTVSVRAIDPQGVNIATLWYSVNDGEPQRVSMTPVDGEEDLYNAVIPGQTTGAVIQFYVEAQDTAGASTTFPAKGAQSRALYRVQDQQARDGIHNFRIIMTPEDTAWLHNPINVLSNDHLGATVIYNESEVFYDVGVRLKGSNAGRSNDPYLGFNVDFDPMQRFRGVHDSVAIDRSGRSGSTPLTQDEILIKHIGNHAGEIPYMYDDLVHLIAPNSIHSRTALLMMARYENSFLDSQFENGSDGTVFKLDVTYVPDGTTDRNPESPKRPYPYSHPQPSRDLQDLGDDKERYRSHLLIRNNRDRDDYQRIIEVSKALSISDPSERLAAAAGVIDLDEWARVFALQSLTGAVDVYTRSGFHHNIEFYVRPADNRVLALPWDWDFAFTAATDQPLIGTLGNGGRLMAQPTVRRLYHGHLLDIINTTFNNEYLDRWIDHYGYVAGQDLSVIKTYVDQRRAYVLRSLPDAFPFEITTHEGEGMSAATPSVRLEGRGWIDVHQIQFAETGQVLETQWLDDESWQITVPLMEGQNSISIRAVDRQGQTVGSDVIDVTLTTGDFNSDGTVDAQDIDLLGGAIRAGDATFDLTGDGQTTDADLTYMVKTVLNTDFGDANLDGVFNSNDLIEVLQYREYEDDILGNSSWSRGDWNGDGEFGTEDIIAALADRGYVAEALSRAAEAWPFESLKDDVAARTTDGLPTAGAVDIPENLGRFFPSASGKPTSKTPLKKRDLSAPAIDWLFVDK